MELLLAVFTRSRRWPPSQVLEVTEPPILPFRAFTAPPAGDPAKPQVQIQGYHKMSKQASPQLSAIRGGGYSYHVHPVLTSWTCSNS